MILLQSVRGRHRTMQLRKAFADYPGLTTAISVALLLIALAVVGFQLWSRSNAPAPRELPGKPRHDPDAPEPHAQMQIGGSEGVSAG